MTSTLHPLNVPPFTILDARQAKWIQRKRYWKGLGIQSEIGRDGTLLYPEPKGESDFLSTRMNHYNIGTSIFDPVLTEVVYNLFTIPGYSILDPFAGGSVRGIVAARLNRQYTGVEIREEQVSANLEQLHIVEGYEHQPAWITGDSNQLQGLVQGKHDFLFSCPPYHHQERYSGQQADLSNLEHWDEFLTAYRNIIKRSSRLLRNNRFACFVVSDFRDDSGILKPLVSETIRAFEDAGMHYHNEAIYLQQLGTVAFRANRSMYATRKLGKAHQTVLVFVKGDARKAADAMNGSVRHYEYVGEKRFKNALKKLKRVGFCQNKQSALVDLGLTVSTVKKERGTIEGFFLNHGIELVSVSYRYQSGNRSNPQQFFVLDSDAMIKALQRNGYFDVQIST